MAGLVQQDGPAAAAEPTDQDVHNMNIARLRATLLEGERRCDMLRTQLAQAEDEQRVAQFEAGKILAQRALLNEQMSNTPVAIEDPSSASNEHIARPPKKARAKYEKNDVHPDELAAPTATAPAKAAASSSSRKKGSSSSSSKAPPKKSAAPMAVAEPVPTVRCPGISQPSFDDALKGTVDESLFSATFLLPDFRINMLEKARAAPPPIPGKAGETRLGYLISRDEALNCDGFVMWKEQWLKRNGYEVELHQLSYHPGDEKKGNQLLEAMTKKLEAHSNGSIFTKVSEKLTQEGIARWKGFGFFGIAGSNTYTRPI